MTVIKQRSVSNTSAEYLQNAGLSPLMARLYAARGVADIAQVSVNLSHLLPPHSLTNNREMAKLLADAIQANKKLLVIGDFLRS